MTVVARLLVPSKTVEDSQTDQYTVSGAAMAVIDKFTCTNYDTSAASISVNLLPVSTAAASSNLVVKDRLLQPSETYTFPELVGQLLTTGQTISTLASVASAINIRVSGREIT